MVITNYYPLGAQVMTLVLPLGWFIVVMIGMYVVFTRPHTVPGHRPIAGARPVAPEPGRAPGLYAASGFPTAPSAGGKAPLADRDTPPVVGARRDDTAAAGQPAADSSGTDESAAEQAPETEKPEDSE